MKRKKKCSSNRTNWPRCQSRLRLSSEVCEDFHPTISPSFNTIKIPKNPKQVRVVIALRVMRDCDPNLLGNIHLFSFDVYIEFFMYNYDIWTWRWSQWFYFIRGYMKAYVSLLNSIVFYPIESWLIHIYVNWNEFNWFLMVLNRKFELNLGDHVGLDSPSNNLM